ncbi:CCA tRNA nucleotidyltransferase [Inquilinus sp. CAU 1745]|uniref:CCA tRNA nucleotidyltransferase n=1 Tax=Inquilinus sp. CAU 1745 TaxID=3140369 RepID=UPI00325BD72C
MVDRPTRLSDAPWLSDPAAGRVMAALSNAGGEGRFVGGCVRDALLKRPLGDIDIATTLTPDRTLAALKAAGLKAVPTGIDHGTVTAVADHRPFEITTLRRDVETDGRRARVAFTDNWAEDASRRDFTMNALYADIGGVLHDPAGGIDDALAGRVRFVGDADRRIAEDVLRLLRFFRFHAWYGKGAPDPDALAACARAAPLLSTLSGERVRAELLKLLSAPDPAPVWRRMIEADVARAALGVDGDADRLARLEGPPDPILRLAALLGPDAPQALPDRLRLSNIERERLATLSENWNAVEDGASAADLRRLAYRLGRPAADDLIRLAKTEGRPPQADLGAWTPPTFPVRGADLLALGLTTGPEVGRLLSELEGWWIAEDFRPDRAALLDRAKTNCPSPNPLPGGERAIDLPSPLLGEGGTRRSREGEGR